MRGGAGPALLLHMALALILWTPAKGESRRLELFRRNWVVFSRDDPAPGVIDRIRERLVCKCQTLHRNQDKVTSGHRLLTPWTGLARKCRMVAPRPGGPGRPVEGICP